MSDSYLSERLRQVRARRRAHPDPLDYPLGLRFRPVEAKSHFDAWAQFARAAQAGEPGSGLTLYIHIPFCAKVCTYCLLSRTRAIGGDATEAYVAALREELRRYAALVSHLPISSLHVGGGTPTILRADQLDGILSDVAELFQTAPGFEMGIEAYPATATPQKLEVMREHGVHRVSMGVESFTPEVLEAVNRGGQTFESVRQAVVRVREAGIPQIGLDLLAGLPKETTKSFEQTVLKTLSLEPDSISVNRFIAENSLMAERGYSPSEQDHLRADEMLTVADQLIWLERPPTQPQRPLAMPGYGTQYVWERSGASRAYFQQDMIGPTSILAVGHGALGHVHGHSYYTSAGSIAEYVAAIESGAPPPRLAAAVNIDFERAFYVGEQVCRGCLSPRGFAATFGVQLEEVYGDELRFLEAAGLVERSERAWRKMANPDFDIGHLLAFLLEGRSGANAAPISCGTSSGAPLAQYDAIQEELPPSVLWCRIAMRAHQASRQSRGELPLPPSTLIR